MLIETGTHLIMDGLMCPYRMGERVRAKKLLRSVTTGMLLMWDRGLHSYAMVHATVAQDCDYLGRVPANVKFEVVKVLEDGSNLSLDCPRPQIEEKRCCQDSSASRGVHDRLGHRAPNLSSDYQFA